jgi:hypothetical protein
MAAAANGNVDAAAASYDRALAAARNLAREPYWSALVLYDYGRWLVQSGRAEEAAPLLAEAQAFFEGVGAVRWLERLDVTTPRAEATARR